jgi:TldD protein
MDPDAKLVEQVCERAGDAGAAFADARITESEGTGVLCQDGRADKVGSGRGRAGGVRVLVEGAWGFASTDEPDEKRLARCLESALAMARASKPHVTEPGVVAEPPPARGESFPKVETDPRGISLEEKLKRVAAYERAAREKHGENLVNTIVSYGDGWTREVVANSRGTLTVSEQIRTRVGSMMVAKSPETRQSGYEHRAGLVGFELLDRTTPDELSVKAADRAVALLDARRAPSGRFPVIFHPTITGLLTHEAIGHNAEAELVFSGQSILEGKLGTRVASEHVTIVDDATIEGSNGSYAYDSEGTPAARRVIVEGGVLKRFLNSLESAARMGAEPEGSGRAQNAHSQPVVRMSNTFIAPGEGTFEDLLAPIELGVYLRGGQWGYVFCERGQFVCNAAEGWMIRKGALAEHLRDVSVSGMTLETLENIDGVSADFELYKRRRAVRPREGARRRRAGEGLEALTEWATEITEITEVTEDDTTGTRGTSTASSAVVPKILAVAVLCVLCGLCGKCRLERCCPWLTC